MTKKILMPLPLTDFDPTESAIPWQILMQNGIDVVFATSNGKEASCDQKMLTGDGLGPCSAFLRADHHGRTAYNEMTASAAFKNPLDWPTLKHHDFDGLLLPGGHAPGMKEYLESECLQQLVVDFFRVEKPVGAICHGVLLAARSRYPNKSSVLFGRKTTALLASQELFAWALTFAWVKNYYRTYPQTVEAEVKTNLATPADFIKGPWPLRRDNLDKLERGFTVLDRNYLSARWPGDAHCFAHQFLALILSSVIS